MWGTASSHQFQRAGDLNVLLHFFFNADLLPNRHLIRRDVDFFTVYKNMAMPDELARLRMCRSKTEPYKYVIQPPLQLCQQVFSGHAFLPHRLLEIRPELIFENAVNALHFLFFAQLQSDRKSTRLN